MVSEGAKIDPAEGRADPRMNLFLSATVEVDGRSLAVRIRNLSVRGAMIESHGLPREGSDIVIERTGMKVGGTLRWASGPRAGVQFDRTINLATWSPSLALSARNQADVDGAVAAVRAGLAPVEPAERSKRAPNDAQLRGRISEEMSRVARMLEAASDALAGDPAVIARHLERLQEFDMAAQMLIELAALLAAEDPAVALGEVKLSDLHRRLTRTAL